MTGDGGGEGRKEKKKGGGNVTSAGWQVTLCDPIGMRVPAAAWQPCELLYTCYLLTYLLRSVAAKT